MKTQLILLAVRVIMALTALGIGIWYLSSSLGGASLTYTSMDSFLNAIGASEDIAGANGCFMCGYIGELFAVLGRATEMFWDAIVSHLWIVMAIGFGLFLVVHTGQYFLDIVKSGASLSGAPKDLALQPWFDKVWRQGLRVIIAGAMLGMLGLGGTAALKTVATITITPVMYVGSELSMAATGISDSTKCAVDMGDHAVGDDEDILNPILRPFMCVIGNLNAVMLAGAGGGFALMNYAWMGLGGGLFTWIAGFGLIIMFLIIGFNLFFNILSVVFKLIFVIIFMPVFIAAAAFEPVWKAASNLFNKAIEMVVKAAIQIIGISLKIIILYATVSFVADEYFPGPADGYSAILPPLLGTTVENPDAQTLSVMNVFRECERVSLTDGLVDADKFKECFIERRTAVEETYPGAFDFMGSGWEFMMMMIGLFFLYYYAVAPRVDKILNIGGKSDFDFGGQIKQLGKNIWDLPTKITSGVLKKIGK